MATRRPLIVNAAANQIQELTDADGLTGNGTIPVGGIIMWSGSIASIPSGWALCDGTNSTPNLTDKFIVGAGSGYAVANTGGSANAIVVSHTHTVTDPGHNHSASVDRDYTFSPRSAGTQSGGSNKVEGLNNQTPTVTIASNTTGISIDTAGSSGTNANLPPYYALAFIMRTI